MKIFNWVHRRFTHKDGFSQNVKNVDHFRTKDVDTQALLDNVVHIADLLDGWQGGVLAIGTFGLDTFNGVLKEDNDEFCQYTVKDEEVFEEDDEYSLQEGECDEFGHDEGGELNPLVSINGLDGSDCHPRGATNTIITIDGIRLSPRDDDNHATDSADHSNKWDCHYMIKKERITLADLFSAESDGNTDSKNGKAQPQLMTKKPTTDTAKCGLPLPKKLIPEGKDDSRPLKKLHQLMKRMLKRKIHPDAEAKIHKDSQSESSGATGILNDESWNNESVSLLQIQADMVCN